MNELSLVGSVTVSGLEFAGQWQSKKSQSLAMSSIQIPEFFFLMSNKITKPD